MPKLKSRTESLDPTAIERIKRWFGTLRHAQRELKLSEMSYDVFSRACRGETCTPKQIQQIMAALAQWEEREGRQQYETVGYVLPKIIETPERLLLAKIYQLLRASPLCKEMGTREVTLSEEIREEIRRLAEPARRVPVRRIALTAVREADNTEPPP
jgi:hypothetical protein